MWVEADCNIPSGESLVRQIVHGKRFFLDEFGRETTDLWLPDVFGYSAALPQILAAAGVTSFLTQKMSWNEINRFPHSTFWWEGIDGTRVLTHFPPADTYNGDMSVGELAKGERQFAQQRSVEALAVPVRVRRRRRRPDAGHARVGARGWPTSTASPRVELGTVASFWEQGARRGGRPARCGWASSTSSTTGAPTRPRPDQARRTGATSRRCARPSCGRSPPTRSGADWSAYPAAALDDAWKLLLLNQFHDIIPGSSIHWANEDCLRDHAQIAAVTDRRDRRRAAGDRRSRSTRPA